MRNASAENILYGKKWAVCGDSFTNGDFRDSPVKYRLSSGPFAGENAVYGYLIGERNRMTIQHLAMGGRTMATPPDGNFTNCFSNGIYRTIDSDVDYITLYFGINDSHHRKHSAGDDGEDKAGIIDIGDISDETTDTFCGAYNVVLKYLITHYPLAHIGILVSNGCETDEYRVKTIAIARKWGIPFLDLNGDERTPMMNRSTNPQHSEEARRIRTEQFRVSVSNSHPSVYAHAYESTFIEQFLRTL